MLNRRLAVRILGGVLVFASLFSVTTIRALADSGLILKSDGNISGETSGYTGSITYDSTAGWTFDNVVYTTSESTAVEFEGDAIINISGTNSITSTYSGTDNSYGIFKPAGSLTFLGSGSLAVTAGGTNQSAGISARYVNVNSGNISAKGGNGNKSYGIYTGDYAGSSVSINGGYVEAEGKDSSIYTSMLSIEDGLPIRGDGGVVITERDDGSVLKTHKHVTIGTAPAGPATPTGPVQHSNPVTIPSYVTYSDTNTPAPTKASISGLTGGADNVSVNISNNVAVVSGITKDIIQGIASSYANGSGIVLDVSKAGNVKNVTLTKETMSNIAEALASDDNNKESLVIKTRDASLALDRTALSAVVSQAQTDSIQIVVENKVNSYFNVDQQSAIRSIVIEEGKEVVSTFEAYIVSGTQRITDFNGGKISVGKLDFKVPAGRVASKYKVYAISEEGEITACETWEEDGVILFSTNSLSNYILVYEA